MPQNPIYVEMFGGFSMSYYGDSVIKWQSRSSKTMSLLQYLIYHQGQSVSKEVFFDMLYDDASEGDPSNTLRVTIHRIRKTLVSSGLPDNPYIFSKNGMCGWSENYPCSIDVRLFERCIRDSSEPGLSDNEKLELLRRAYALYKGEFLSMSASESWVAVESIRLKKLYFDCINGICAILSSHRDFEEVADICRRAAIIYPYDEELHCRRISALIELNRYKDALAVYDEVSKLFFEELGIKPSPAMALLYDKISDRMPNVSESLDTIKKQLNDDENGRGAYYCNYLTFVNSYRYMMRVTERSSQSAFLMLCALTDSSGNTLESGDRLSQAASVLHSTIKESLRGGDLYTRYNPNLFLVLLLGITQENCSIVSRRIADRFRAEYAGKGVRLKYKFTPAQEPPVSDARPSFKNNSAVW